MFNIYEEEGEEFTENAKLREVFKRVQHHRLQDTVKALKVSFDMEGITYAQAANHLTAAVSELPEYHLTRKVSASSSGTPMIRGGGGNRHNNNIKKKVECKPQTKASSCQMDWFSQGITQTGRNYQRKTRSMCWIHGTRRRREVLVTNQAPLYYYDDASVELYSEGTIICGDTRTPTESELGQLPWLIMTYLHDWDPTMSVSLPAVVSHLVIHQSSLTTGYSQWIHYCNTQFMTLSC